MKRLDFNDLMNFKENSVAAIGFFDGVHKAHQEIFTRLIDKAKKEHLKSIVITFDDSLLEQFKITNSLYSLEEKEKILEEYGVDYLYVFKYIDHLFRQTPDEFIEKYLKSLNCKCIVCGNDFTFGKDKLGDVNYLRKNTNIEVIEVDDIFVNGSKISSTYIRSLLKDGKIKEANSLLYYPYSLTSSIIQGNKIGGIIGYKTANLKPVNQAYLLKHGVYYCKAHFEEKVYDAMVNVGTNPTININNNLKIEAHLLGFDKDIYGETITLEFIDFIREENKYNSLKELKNQIEIDINKINEIKKI